MSTRCRGNAPPISPEEARRLVDETSARVWTAWHSFLFVLHDLRRDQVTGRTEQRQIEGLRRLSYVMGGLDVGLIHGEPPHKDKRQLKLAVGN